MSIDTILKIIVTYIVTGVFVAIGLRIIHGPGHDLKTYLLCVALWPAIVLAWAQEGM